MNPDRFWEKNRPLKQWISRIPSILNPYNASSLFASPHSPTSSRAIKPSSAPKPGNGSTEVIATIVVVAVPTAKSHQPDQPNLTKYQQVANTTTHTSKSILSSLNVEQTQAFTMLCHCSLSFSPHYRNERERERERRREGEKHRTLPTARKCV